MNGTSLIIYSTPEGIEHPLYLQCQEQEKRVIRAGFILAGARHYDSVMRATYPATLGRFDRRVIGRNGGVEWLR